MEIVIESKILASTKLDNRELMGVNEDEMSMLFEVLRNNMYSDSIGSIVREVASNCVDATSERDIYKKICPEEDKKWLDDRDYFEIAYREEKEILGLFECIIFRDFGIGISPKRMNSVYRNYFSSTKRKTNELIGGFGIGAKSPWSYSEEFYIETRYNGTKYVYLAYIDESNIGAIRLVHSEPTLKTNGTEIQIPIKEGDRFDFIQAAQNQLRYFNNFKLVNIVIDHNILFSNEHFIRSSYDSGLGVCVGTVHYEIELEKLIDKDYPEININPLASGSIIVGIGEIDLVASRESIKYSKRTKLVLLQKLEDLRKMATESIRSSFQSCNNYVEYCKICISIVGRNKDNSEFFDDTDYWNNFLGSLTEIHYSDLPSYKGFKCLKKSVFTNHLDISVTKSDIKGEVNRNVDYSRKYNRVLHGDFYFRTGELNKKKDLHLCTNNTDLDFVLFHIEKDVPFHKVKNKNGGLNVEDWYKLELLKDDLLKLYGDKSYDNIEPDQELINSVFGHTSSISAKEYRNMNDLIFYKSLTINSYTSSENYISFHAEENTIEFIRNIDKKIVYGFSNDDPYLKLAAGFFNSFDETQYKIIKISKDLEDIFEDYIYIEEFLMEINDFIKEKVTHYTLQLERDDIIDNRIETLTTIHDKFQKAVKNTRATYLHISGSNELFKQLMEYHVQEKNFDESIVNSVREARFDVKDLKLLSFLDCDKREENDYIESVKEYLQLKGLQHLINL